MTDAFVEARFEPREVADHMRRRPSRGRSVSTSSC